MLRFNEAKFEPTKPGHCAYKVPSPFIALLGLDSSILKIIVGNEDEVGLRSS